MRWFPLLALALTACDKTNDDTGTGNGVPDDALKFEQENNYSYTGDIVIGEVQVQSGADSMVDWCALTIDLRGRAVTDPSSVDQVLLAEFALSQEELMAKIETNDIYQNDSASQWLVVEPEACSVPMSQFEVIGNVFDPSTYMVENADRTWLASVMNTPDDRLDILMSTFVVPKGDSTNDVVTLDDDSATLTFEADLHSAPALQVAAGEVPWVDWSGVSTDVNGAPYDPLLGDRLVIGKVPVATVEEAEDVFLRLDEEAEMLYFINVYGKTAADLSTATSADGAKFDGFTTDGIWFVGVECLTCTSPAPLILTVVEVSG